MWGASRCCAGRIRDFQTNVVSGAVGVLRGYLANVPKVRTQGIEADIALRPSRNIDAYLNIACTDARYLDFPQAPPPPERACHASRHHGPPSCRAASPRRCRRRRGEGIERQGQPGRQVRDSC